MPPAPKTDAKEPLSSLAPLPAYSPEGVDLTLIRWMLSLTPAERLAVLQSNLNSILRLRDAISRQ